jgi:hypothetical protein
MRVAPGEGFLLEARIWTGPKRFVLYFVDAIEDVIYGGWGRVATEKLV